MKNIIPDVGNLYKKSDNDLKPTPPEGPLGFEDAIAATKFGKFNIMLLGFSLFSGIAFIFDTTVIPYVIPSAECDLQISLLNKGVLNAMAHTGMICSAILVGFVADTIGRKKVLLCGLFVDMICNILATFSHEFIYTVILKFISGFFMGGTNTVLISILAEYHSEKVRPKTIMFMGFGFAVAMLAVPILAIMFLTNPYDIHLGGGYVFHSWQTFMGVCSIPATLATIMAFFLPESPRFLISKNRLPEALLVLQKMYSINTGLPADTYPVKELKCIRAPKPIPKEQGNELSTEEGSTGDVETEKKKTALGAMKGGLMQLRPLLLPPHIQNMLIMFFVQFAGVAGCNALRLWLPQLFKMMSENEEAGSLCEMISLGNTTIVQTPFPINGVCEPIKVNVQTYTNSIIVAGVQVCFCAVAGLCINFIGKRRLLVSALMGGGLCTLGLYWCMDSVQATALASITIALTATCMNAAASIAVDLFPTSLRAMGLSLILMVGRTGSIIGSITFPALLAAGCLPPFLAICCILVGGALMALLIPAQNKAT